MNRSAAFALLCIIIFMVGFATWHFYRGDLTAALSTLPFLAIVYLFLVNRRGR